MMIGAVLAAGLAASASGQISMREVQRIDLFALNNDQSNTFIGTNVAAIAWNGTDLFAAGFNGAAASGTGVARYSGGSFQLMQFIAGTPGARGFSGLDISGDRLAAAYDDGAADAQGLQVFDTNSNMSCGRRTSAAARASASTPASAARAPASPGPPSAKAVDSSRTPRPAPTSTADRRPRTA